MDKLRSNRLNGIGEYYFSQKLREIDALNAEGKNILNLGIGSPDMPPPVKVKEALIDSLGESNFHQYQSYKGIPELRKAFASWYHNHFEVTLNSESEVLPLIGSKEGIIHISMALLNERDQVLVPNPGYPAYRAATKLAGAEPVDYALNEANNYQPNFDLLEEEDLTKVKLMWVNYPHMPTGTEGSGDLFEKLIQFSRKHQIVIVNDNPYGFILTNKRASLLARREESDLLLELNSLSKSHNMAGWRLGVLAGNSELIQTTLTFKSNVDSGQFKPVMRAAIAALEVDNEWYKNLNHEYQVRKELVDEVISLIGCKGREDEVGMFRWVKIPSGCPDGETFTDELLSKYRIFVPPGSVFGSEGKNYIRFSLCSPQSVWEEVIKRIKETSSSQTV